MENSVADGDAPFAARANTYDHDLQRTGRAQQSRDDRDREMRAMGQQGDGPATDTERVDEALRLIREIRAEFEQQRRALVWLSQLCQIVVARCPRLRWYPQDLRN